MARSGRRAPHTLLTLLTALALLWPAGFTAAASPTALESRARGTILLPDGSPAEGVRLHLYHPDPSVQGGTFVETLVSELPERIVDQTRAVDSSYLTTVHFTAVDERTTQLRVGISIDSLPGRVFERLAASLTTGRQARKALARFKEFAELTYAG